MYERKILNIYPQVEEAEIKSEVFSVYELERLYENVHTFTPMCLESLCEILDASRSWEHLADLLDLKHLLRTTDLFEIRPTKTLLELAIVSERIRSV